MEIFLKVMLFKENHSSLKQKSNWTHTARDRLVLAVEALCGNAWFPEQLQYMMQGKQNSKKSGLGSMLPAKKSPPQKTQPKSVFCEHTILGRHELAQTEHAPDNSLWVPANK